MINLQVLDLFLSKKLDLVFLNISILPDQIVFLKIKLLMNIEKILAQNLRKKMTLMQILLFQFLIVEMLQH